MGLFSVSGPGRRFITDGESLGAVEFRSSKGAVMCPEVVKEIRLCQEDLMCDFTCAVVQQYWECVI
jgi:hypothetical protein